MSKFNNRLKRLESKQCNFISRADFLLIFKYWKAFLADNGINPDDHRKQSAEFNEMLTAAIINCDPAGRQRAKELLHDDDNIRLTWLYLFAEKNVADYPNGVWLPKKESDHLSLLIRDAKKYLAAKDKES